MCLVITSASRAYSEPTVTSFWRARYSTSGAATKPLPNTSTLLGGLEKSGAAAAAAAASDAGDDAPAGRAPGNVNVRPSADLPLKHTVLLSYSSMETRA